jgi:hypothetical protein
MPARPARRSRPCIASSCGRCRNRLRGLRDRYRAGSVRLDEVTPRVASWIAHAEYADTWPLRQAIFRGGPFDPSRRPDRPPRRVLRGGSWNNNPRNLRAANRNRNTTGNRNNNFRMLVTGSRDGVRSHITTIFCVWWQSSIERPCRRWMLNCLNVVM